MSKCAGQLYQLESKTELNAGSYVAVNGPWDRFGTVRTSTLQPSGKFLNLIRGVPERKGERPVASF